MHKGFTLKIQSKYTIYLPKLSGRRNTPRRQWIECDLNEHFYLQSKVEK